MPHTRVLLPSNTKLAYIFLKIVHFLNVTIFHVFCVVLRKMYGLMTFANHCSLFLLIFYAVSQLFGNWVCIYNRRFTLK